jgi:hypothetical protein
MQAAAVANAMNEGVVSRKRKHPEQNLVSTDSAKNAEPAQTTGRAAATVAIAIVPMAECMICEECLPLTQIAQNLCADPQHFTCNICVVAAFKATGRAPACPVKHCRARLPPTIRRMQAAFENESPAVARAMVRAVTIHQQLHYAPCPVTGVMGTVSNHGDWIDFTPGQAARSGLTRICNWCLQQTDTVHSYCDCRDKVVKHESALNPYFRHIAGPVIPQVFGIARNFQITDERMRRFFEFVILTCRTALPAACPGCATKLHKSARCNEMTCPQCDLHICYHCGRAEKAAALVDHYGIDKCPRFDAHTALSHWNSVLQIRCPCTSECQNERSDCVEPEHELWRRLLRQNRCLIWIDCFIRALDPGRQKRARKLLLDEFTPTNPKSFAALFVHTGGLCHVRANARV